MKNISDYFNLFKETLDLESKAISRAKTLINEDQVASLISIFDYLHRLGGTLFICGVGKSGHIGQKLSATFSSLGLISHSLNPVEALHGDLGRVRENDAILFLTKSGSTEEILKLIPFLPIKKEMIISLVGNIDSEIAKKSFLVFDCSVEKEACLNNLAPTTSSTTALAMGDAMSVVYEKFIGLSKEGFAVNHPAGRLGKSLLLKVSDLMCAKDDCPTVGEKTLLNDVLIEMTAKNIGGCAVLSKDKEFLGIIVEGDIRRALVKKFDLTQMNAMTMMTKDPIVVSKDDLALDALNLMEKRERQITVLPVVEKKEFLGIIRLHDILKEGL